MAVTVEYTTWMDEGIASPKFSWTFFTEEDVICRSVYNEDECVNWKQYVMWCVKENLCILRVWVNGIEVWHFKEGWRLNIDDLSYKDVCDEQE